MTKKSGGELREPSHCGRRCSWEEAPKAFGKDSERKEGPLVVPMEVLSSHVEVQRNLGHRAGAEKRNRKKKAKYSIAGRSPTSEWKCQLYHTSRGGCAPEGGGRGDENKWKSRSGFFCLYRREEPNLSVGMKGDAHPGRGAVRKKGQPALEN